MLDLLTILLGAFVVLLIVQIVALVRIRQMIVRLRSMLRVIAPILQRHHDIQNARKVNMRICQFCKFRQTYIKATSHGDDDFYYLCKIRNKEVDLTDTCKHFQLETDF